MQNGWYAIDRHPTNLAYNHIMFDDEDFRDLRKTGAPAGKEPRYDFSADVAQVFVSIWF